MVPDVAPVTIGSRSIKRAGSVGTKNVPPDVLAEGDPNKVTRPLEENDKPGNQARN